MNQEQQIQHRQCGGLPFKRTICSCETCKEYCKIMPGYTIWDDLVVIYHYVSL